MQRTQRLSMHSSGVNEGFTQLVHVFVLQNNAHALCQWPCTVEIWRTFFGALGASAICSFSFPVWMFTTGCRGVVFVGSSTSGTLSRTSCDSTCESFRCRFLSLDARLNIHGAQNVGLTLFITVALLCFEALGLAETSPILQGNAFAGRQIPGPDV